MNEQEMQYQGRVAVLQEEVRAILSKERCGRAGLALQYGPSSSNTTRTKFYNKRASGRVSCGTLTHIIRVDVEKKRVVAEARVTMEQLVDALLPLGLCVPIIPEFKGITVGGAIMGAATESAAHRYGLFHDVCESFEILLGNGEVVRASPFENQDLFYGLPGSYGSLGVLLSADIRLVPVDQFVRVAYHVFRKPLEALDYLRQRTHAWDAPDFLDGLIFSPHHAVVIEGFLQAPPSSLPHFSMKSPSSEWYFQHVRRATTEVSFFEEQMSLREYLFRYDTGAFWMGSYLLSQPFATRFLVEGFLKMKQPTSLEYTQMKEMKGPNGFLRGLFRPWMGSKSLWNLFHKAEEWIQERTIIQDFCLPEAASPYFLEEVIQEIAIFPLWLCPIKGTKERQIFSPHLLPEKGEATHVINVGVYGVPPYTRNIVDLTRAFEAKTRMYGGRKVLYSRSYYTEEEFWHIYSRGTYERLREKFFAQGVWKDITEKVLSV